MRKRTTLLIAAAAFAAGALVPMAAFAGAQRFDDVPPTDWAFDDIEWLADVGVTNGCGDGTNYCPDDAVTRREIAAIAHRLADLLMTQVHVAKSESVLRIEDEATVLVESGFNAAAPSILSATAAITLDHQESVDPGGVTDMQIWMQLDNSDCDRSESFGRSGVGTVAAIGVEPYDATVSLVQGVQVTPGAHTLTLCGKAFGDQARIFRSALTATVTPETMSSLIDSTVPGGGEPAPGR